MRHHGFNVGLAGFVLLFVLISDVGANIIGAQFNASDGGVSDTVGGNGTYNLYLSQDGGSSFINTGNDAATAINISTSVNGLFTYQFYYFNGFSNSLNLQLFLDGGTIGVGTARDTSPFSFSELYSGSSSVVDSGATITLTEYEFTNGSGPAEPFAVTSGGSFSPQLLGHFTYEVTGASASSVPLPGTIYFFLSGLVAFGCRMRRKI